MEINKKNKKHLTSVRSLLKSGDLASFKQAIELLQSLNEPELWSVLTEGLRLSSEGKIEIGKGEIKKRVKHLYRAHRAFHVARYSGLLDECTSLDLSERLTMNSLVFPTEDLALISGLQKLEDLKLYFAHRNEIDDALLHALEGAPNLHTIKLVKCLHLRSLQSFGILSQLDALKTLVLVGCTSLVDLGGLKTLTQLQHLKIEDSMRLKELSNLVLPKNLLSLDISSGITMMDKVTSLQHFESSPQLESLSLRSMGRLQSLNGIQGMKNLHTLQMFGCVQLRNWEALENVSNLQTLTLTKISNYPFHLESLSCLPLLRELDLSGCKKLSNSEASLPKLQILHLRGVGTKWSGPIVHLRYLLEDTEGLSHVQYLNLSKNSKLESIDGLGILPNLSTLSLRECRVLKSIAGLQASAPVLSELSLSGCQRLVSLSGIEGMQHLQHLDLTGCSTIKSIEELKEIKTLTSLNLSKCKSISDYSPLRELDNLRSLTLSKRLVGSDVISELQRFLPQVEISL